MNWSDYLLGFAEHAAKKSKDSTQVGAALVKDKSVLVTGFNGPPRGVRDLPDRFERPRKYLYAAHAEMNVISTAARLGVRTEGCILYVTHAPCSACARLIIQSGISGVVVGAGATAMPEEEFEAAAQMLDEAGVTFFRKGPLASEK